MKHKKGYYLILDSLIALAIFSVGILLISSLNSGKTEQMISKHHADEIMDILSAAKITELCGTATSSCGCRDGELESLCSLPEPEIKNFKNTVIDLIGELHFRHKNEPENEEIKQLISSIVISNKLIPNDFGFSFIVHEDNDAYEYYPTLSHPPMADSTSDTAKLLLQSKKIIFGFWEESNGQLHYWGPYTAEARVWQK